MSPWVPVAYELATANLKSENREWNNRFTNNVWLCRTVDNEI